MSEFHGKHINFANGQPNDSLLPQQLIQEAASSLFQPPMAPADSDLTSCSRSSHPLNYGDLPDHFRTSLASFLSASSLCGEGRESERVDPHLLVPTTGVSHGLDMICAMMCKKHNVQRPSKGSIGSHFVWVEDATYYLSSSIFKDYGLEVRSVRTDSEGIVTEDLAQQLNDLQQQPHEPRPLFLYTIPLFNNPTGRCISVARKQQLLAITRAHGLPVVSDEVYQMLDASNHLQAPSSSSSSWSRLPPLRSLLSLLDLPEVDDTGNEDSAHSRRPDNVLVVSSFSKILAPGLRVGWIQCSTQQQAQDLWGLGFMRSGSSSCHFSACLVARLLQPLDPPAAPFRCLLDGQVTSLCATYARKYETLASALLEYSSQLLAGGAGGALHIEGLQSTASSISSDNSSSRRKRVGGYFLWVRLPHWCIPAGDSDSSSSMSLSAFLQAAQAAELSVRAGEECTGNGTGNKEFIRLCFARLDEKELREGARRLCLVLADLYQQQQQP